VDPAKPVVQALLPDALVERLLRPAYSRLRDVRILGEPDRRFLHRQIVPALRRSGIRRLLFVGVRSYTRGTLRQLQDAGIEVWTTDIDPAAQAFGVKGRHLTADIRSLSSGMLPFQPDAIVMNGVLGYGVDSEADCAQTLASVADLLPPNGRLLLGWNTDRCPDIPALSAAAGLAPAALPGLEQTVTFPGSTHVYTFLVKPA